MQPDNRSVAPRDERPLVPQVVVNDAHEMMMLVDQDDVARRRPEVMRALGAMVGRA